MAVSQTDLKNLAWTMLGEAHPGDTAGMTAVGNTVLNRLSAGNYGNSITHIVKAPNQYAAWGIGSQAASQGNAPDRRFPEGSPEFQAALQLATQLTQGEIPDNTQGATDYRAASLGTKWAKGANTINIGGNVFKVGGVDSTGMAYAGGGNSSIRQTQQALKAAGFDPGPVDGVRGPQTKAAIKAFQQANGLTVDGIAGPQTQAVLAASGGQLDAGAAQRALLGAGGRPNGPLPAPAPLVTLPSGHQVAPGVYPSNNPGHTITVNADGTITHNTNPGEIPGLIDPLHEGPNTIAGGIIGPALDSVRNNVGGALNSAGTAIQSAAGGATNALAQGVQSVGNTARGAMNYLSSLFGNRGQQPSVVAAGPPSDTEPAHSTPAPSPGGGQAPAGFGQWVAGNNRTTMPVNAMARSNTVNVSPSGNETPVAQAGTVGMPAGARPAVVNTMAGHEPYDSVGSGGNFGELQRMISAGSMLSPTTTYTQQQMESANPAYLNYIAAQKADPIGTGVGSFGDLQNALATTSPIGPAPSRTITTTHQVAAPNEGVRQLQTALGISADGLYGPQTQAAVKSFQQAHGLAVDGIVGPQTLAALTGKGLVPPVTAAPVNTMARSGQSQGLPNVAGNGPVTGTKTSAKGYTHFNGDNGVQGNSGNWFNDVTGRG